MITFKNFLTENSQFDIDKFKDDCTAFLNELKKVPSKNRAMYHGTISAPKDWEIRTWKERDKPRDTPQTAHSIFNNFFKNKLGAPVRNWMFATTEYTTAKVYAKSATPSVIFPIGNFEFVALNDASAPKLSYDLTAWHASVMGKLKIESNFNISDNAAASQAAHLMVGEMQHMKWNTTNIAKALTFPNAPEIMFKCDKYYIFNAREETYSNIVQPFVEHL